MQYLAKMVSENVAQVIGDIFNLCEMLGLPFEMFCIWHFRLETGSAPHQFT